MSVKNPNRSKEFFGKLGFMFNPMFTDENVACMVISEESYVILLTEAFFKNFILGRKICDTSKSTETLVALGLESCSKVDEIIRNAGQPEDQNTERSRTPR